MKGIRFFLEYLDKKEKRKGTRKEPGDHMGTVIAVIDGTAQSIRGQVIEDCISAVFDEPNSPVCGSTVSWSYLDDRCKRISESMARDIHPALFEYLDA